MHQAFYKLDSKKQRQIINAALNEFTQKGPHDASTNAIVSVANISKGTLFYYFKNKQSLYHYLIDYALEFVREEYLNKVDMSQQDIFNRIQAMMIIKMKMLKSHPTIINFLSLPILATTDNELSDDLVTKIKQLEQQSYDVMTENIDYSYFKNDVNPTHALQLIQFMITGYSESVKQHLTVDDITNNNYTYYFHEFEVYLAEMRKLFYK
ncbi:TetR/AcrR family transcriptional regulator [Staphylococcus arlettae]|uniref:TetR/AcrR family transcriptional regulator n=2 Tax=Staphylococcus arlettae TaxID=29378 RepID=UPI00028236DC|nr:TetR/AcrR family transcriptional regulator [Staphylococcus arlettae]EJY96882.1 TetR family transcriptional regulator [Staphylococcus arlettae CVD059]MCD9055575.1 TetR/AcrR family transcriptional regulator [Staphylococcus arlettae]UXU52880.1 TetR/AcrR family transcriptional regulator [Staphylococcus arlettae]BBK27199.1 TetR family transcriptional regulator [Staphylococcus arlettae]